MILATTFNMEERVTVVSTQEEALVVGIKIEVHEDCQWTELYNIRTGNGQKIYGFDVQQLQSRAGGGAKIQFRESFQPTGEDYMKYKDMKFTVVRELVAVEEYDQSEGNPRMYVIRLENGEEIHVFNDEVEAPI